MFFLFKSDGLRDFFRFFYIYADIGISAKTREERPFSFLKIDSSFFMFVIQPVFSLKLAKFADWLIGLCDQGYPS